MSAFFVLIFAGGFCIFCYNGNMSNIILKFFTPAIKAMSRLRYFGKFTLIVSFFIVPISILLFLWLPSVDMAISRAKNENIGVEYIVQVSKLLRNVQQHRGATNAFLIGDATYKRIILEREVDIEKNIIDIDALDARFGSILQSTESWKDIKNQWYSIRERAVGFSSEQDIEESFFIHTSLTNNILFFMRDVSENSELFLDPQIDSAHLAFIVTEALPSVSENLGQARAMGMRISEVEVIATTEKYFYINAVSSTRNNIREIDAGIKIVADKNPTLKIELEALADENIAKIQMFTEYIESQLIASDVNGIMKGEFWNVATEAVDSSFKLQDAIYSALHQILQERVDSLSLQKNAILVSILFALVFAMYFYAGLYLSVKKIVFLLGQMSQKMVLRESVDLIKLEAKDELAEVANSFNLAASVIVKSSQELDIAKKKLEEANLILENEKVSLEGKVKERTMALESLKDSLETAVQQKTSELKNRVVELEKFEKVAVGRELKMIELKNEIDELKKRMQV